MDVIVVKFIIQMIFFYVLMNNLYIHTSIDYLYIHSIASLATHCIQLFQSLSEQSTQIVLWILVFFGWWWKQLFDIFSIRFYFVISFSIFYVLCFVWYLFDKIINQNTNFFCKLILKSQKMRIRWRGGDAGIILTHVPLSSFVISGSNMKFN